MRVFVAIDIPDHVRDALERLHADLPVGRAMAAETFHLTLAFLGEVPEAVMVTVHEALNDLRADPFVLRFSGVDVFGGKQPRLVWAGVAHQPELGALRKKIHRSIGAAGLKLPRERFRPHVTLARLSGPLRSDEAGRLGGFLMHHGEFPAEPFMVEHIGLFRSILDSDRARHELLAEYSLD